MKAAEAMDYQQKAYLIFFKPYKQEAYIIEAMSRGDINAMEQQNSGMQDILTESYTKSRELGNYKGDDDLRLELNNALNYFKSASAKHYPTLVDFFVKKDEFEKLKKMMDTKKKKDITNEDIDKYNAAVNSYNASTKKFNETNELMNKLRAQVLNKWNKASNKFFDQHAN